MNNHDYKIRLIEALKSRPIITQQVSSVEIRTRCPWCGDSKVSSTKARLYIKINPNDNSPIVYHCFNCPAQGILDKDDLELLNINDKELVNNFDEFSKNLDHISNRSRISEERYFSYELPEVDVSDKKIKYIFNRFNVTFSNEELRNMRVITSFRDFLKLNKINEVYCKPAIARMLEDDYVGFLSSNNAFILFRSINNTNKIRWYKYRINKESEGQRLLYSIKTEIDLYSSEDINVNISEGIFDAVGIHKFIDSSDSSVNIAICSHHYVNMVKYLISTGLVGKNIVYNIYADRDYTEDTSEDFLRKHLKKYIPFTKEINLCYNTLDKDCGVPKDRIFIKKIKI